MGETHEVDNNFFVELVKGVGALVELVVTGDLTKVSGARVHHRAKTNGRRLADQASGAFRDVVSGAGPESDDAYDGGH